MPRGSSETVAGPRPGGLVMSRRAYAVRRWLGGLGQTTLLGVTSLSLFAVLFIFYYIARDALPFFRLEGAREFFTHTAWYPSREPAEFGAAAIFIGSGIVTLGAALVAVPLGILAAVTLSEILPFGARQALKPVVELLAAIPSVAYGFFALVVLAPALQSDGGPILRAMGWIFAGPVAALAVVRAADRISGRWADRAGGEKPAARRRSRLARIVVGLVLGAVAFGLLHVAGAWLAGLKISSGTNALNVSLILGLMALPTVVSVSEDALQAVGRDLREGSYALGATRAETVFRTVLPSARSGIVAAVILGLMRAIGETMVVWMASGNAAQIPRPWFNVLQPVRTLTATIAGDMGEADHVTGSARYHVLFAMALCLLAFSFACNLVSERMVRKAAMRGRP